MLAWWWADWQERFPPVSTIPARSQFSILIFIHTVLQLQGQTDEASRQYCWGIRGAMDGEVLAWCVSFQSLIFKSSRRLGRVKFQALSVVTMQLKEAPIVRQHTKSTCRQVPYLAPTYRALCLISNLKHYFLLSGPSSASLEGTSSEDRCSVWSAR